MKKRILVACGTGIATSTMVANKIQSEITNRNEAIDVVIDQCKVAEVSSLWSNYDLIVSTTQVPSDVKIPVISGLPFLTGVGLDKVIEDIIEKLKS
ncbi:PTS sugar transporter subunit IIB [Tepidimicrobium xylanilyticum]|uniref:PTS sugar transporter subunit IIB n=1 Tax=Tepidimicrobium xylanilyticum TaxID=1123352 RepID=UPI00264FBA13|nr:PTS sugar transporter subunit IIB [Tepidimicrobium xylanilyticum]GMG97920.1 PTS galactitol transporter subunit IIB [Tepidimicrobium xylanilyticum]